MLLAQHQTKTYLIVIWVAFFLVCCNDVQEDSIFVARVNDSVLTEAALNSMMESSGINKYRSEIIRQWVEKEILYQEAVNLELTENSFFESTLETSKKEIAAAVLLKEHYKFSETEVDEDELLDYYKESIEELRLSDYAYLYNIVSFNDENSAIDFRKITMNNGWNEISNFQNLSSHVTEFTKEYFQYEYQIRSQKILRVLKNLLPGEVSIVLRLEPERYTIVQILNKFKKGSIPKFEYIKNVVESRYNMIRRKKIYSEYYKELYSKYNVEIKKEFE